MGFHGGQKGIVCEPLLVYVGGVKGRLRRDQAKGLKVGLLLLRQDGDDGVGGGDGAPPPRPSSVLGGAQLALGRGARPLHVRYHRRQEARAPPPGGRARRRRDRVAELGPLPIGRQLQPDAALPRGRDRAAGPRARVLRGVRRVLPELRPVRLLVAAGGRGVQLVLRRTHDAPDDTAGGQVGRLDRGRRIVRPEAEDDRERRRGPPAEPGEGDDAHLRRHRK